MGHEFCGRIISAPEDSNLRQGQAVMVDPRIFCSKCSRCSAGQTQGCTSLGFKGLSGTGGGFAEKVAIDAKLCYSLPDSVDLSLAALIEPLAVAWHAMAMCDIPTWSTKSALILGGGPIGIATALVLRAHGCTEIFISEPTSTRAAKSKEFALDVFNPITNSIGDKCRERTGGQGVDVVFDCAGVQKGMDAGFDALRFRGLYMNVSVWSTQVRIPSHCIDKTDGLQMVMPFMQSMMKEITAKYSLAYNDKDFKETVDFFIAGKKSLTPTLDRVHQDTGKFKGLEKMVTSRVHLDNISTKGFEELVNNKDDQIKILISPDRTRV